MAKTIKLTAEEWRLLRHRLQEEYKFKPSVLAIQSVCRRELGFTTRYHRGWISEDNLGGAYDAWGNWEEQVHLDFWDDEKETFFRLKYL